MFTVRTLPSTYREYNEYLGRRNRRKLCHNTYAERNADMSIDIRYHQTVIATLHPPANTDLLDIDIQHGGWWTVTTKARLNRILFDRAHVFSVAGIARISFSNGRDADFYGVIRMFTDGSAIRTDNRMSFINTVA